MNLEEILETISDSSKSTNTNELLNQLFPPKTEGSYRLTDVENRLNECFEELEILQRNKNDDFDSVLDCEVKDRLRNLSQDLHETRIKMMKLQCDIGHTREQFAAIKNACNNPILEEQRHLIVEEEKLKCSMRQSKFRPIIEFFDRFINYLETSVITSRKLLSLHVGNEMQSFEWTHHNQVLFLIRACGKSLSDIELCEKIYQRCPGTFANIKFKQPLDEVFFNNFIELPATYSLATQLEVKLSDSAVQLTFGKFLTTESVAPYQQSENDIQYELLRPSREKLKSINKDCCQLLIDLNLTYIEAQFTNGINIDRLNGNDGSSDLNIEQPAPLYSFSPQEYITQIGQHLLTLRKQIDQFEQVDVKSLKSALVYLNSIHGISFDIESCATITETIMRCIARHCIRSLVGRTTNSVLSQLTTNGRRQLATDAMYLDNVLEDLSLKDPDDPNLHRFMNLFTQ